MPENAEIDLPAASSPRPTVAVRPGQGWRAEERGAWRLRWAGWRPAVERVLARLEEGALPDPAALAPLLAQAPEHFALIVEAPGWLFCAVDRVRSWPLYYRPDAARPAVGNQPRTLVDTPLAEAVDAEGLRDFLMCGYVTGGQTVHRDVRQMQAGELLLWTPAGGLRVERYFRYRPRPDNGLATEAAMEGLGVAIDVAFRRAAEQAGGRPIWIPLSGGYDSRLNICKLHEIGYDNLVAFSYGPSGNHDARIAREVAERLGVRWLWVPSTAAPSHRTFHTARRQDYWRFADGFSVLPSLREWHALLELEAQLPDDVLLMNGNAGDFLSGGHVPPVAMPERGLGVEGMLQGVVDRHWSLWGNLKGPQGQAFARARVRRAFPDAAVHGYAPDDAAAEYETWECEERQCKFIIGGQRMYDFLERDWLLPHWDGALIDFWTTVPYRLKFGQGVFKAYLKRWDHKGLFDRFDPFAWRWPMHMMWVVPLARGVGLLAGRAAKDRVYRTLWYWGHYRNAYAPYSYRHYLSRIPNARNPISFYVESWLAENGLDVRPNELGG